MSLSDYSSDEDFEEGLAGPDAGGPAAPGPLTADGAGLRARKPDNSIQVSGASRR